VTAGDAGDLGQSRHKASTWARFHRLLNQADAFFVRKFLPFAASVAIPILIYIGARWVTQLQSRAERLVGLALFVLALAGAVGQISTRRGRQAILRSGFRLSLMFASTLAIVSTAVFAGITMELVQSGWVELTPTPKAADGLVDFYMWQLVNVLPGGITTTLRWDPGFDYQQSRVGGLILLYTLAVVAPIVALLRELLPSRRASLH
jgi:hypothetical protein